MYKIFGLWLGSWFRNRKKLIDSTHIAWYLYSSIIANSYKYITTINLKMCISTVLYNPKLPSECQYYIMTLALAKWFKILWVSSDEECTNSKFYKLYYNYCLCSFWYKFQIYGCAWCFSLMWIFQKFNIILIFILLLYTNWNANL